MRAKDCIFCKVIGGEMETKRVLESELSVAIEDINPVANVHILILPKRHIESVETIRKEDGESLADMHILAQKIVEKMKLDAFRLAFNGGKYAHVPHLHMHLLAGKEVSWSKL